MRVLLVGHPPILNELLAAALGHLSHLEFVDSDAIPVDVVLRTILEPDECPTFDVKTYGLVTGGTVITLDAVQNVLRVWPDGPGGVGERILPGHMERLIDVLCALGGAGPDDLFSQIA